MEKEIKLKCGTIKRIEGNIIFACYHEGYEIRLADVKQIDEAFFELANEDKIYSLMDSSNRHTYFTKEAQNYLAKEAKSRYLLVASVVVLNQLPMRILARFFVTFHKPNYPVKICKSIEEGKKWIKNH